MTNKYVVTEQNAMLIAEWIRSRGGCLVWGLINLSNPSGSWTTPKTDKNGVPCSKPTWQAGDVPDREITDPADVLVSHDIEVNRFHVAIKRGDGFNLKVTDGGSRRIRAAVAKAGHGSYHVFDYMTQEAVIMKPSSQVPLTEWLKDSRK